MMAKSISVGLGTASVYGLPNMRKYMGFKGCL